MELRWVQSILVEVEAGVDRWVQCRQEEAQGSNWTGWGCSSLVRNYCKC